MRKTAGTYENGHSENGLNSDGDSDLGYSKVDLRTLMPVMGLKEYWYPAVFAKDVGKKPVLLRLLDKEVCLFRGKAKNVVAIENACVHRGGMLHMGDCWWPGTISCFYHGWTYDETGEVVAVLSEGPDCQIPGQVKTKVYPTRTLHGVVFIWMGDQEPVPIEEDVPPQFLDEKALVLGTMTYWEGCNWRQALENINDSHVQYLHRNSLRMLKYPTSMMGTGAPRPSVINGRALTNGRPPVAVDKEPYKHYFPELGERWPRSRWRLAWTWLFALIEKRTPKQPLKITDREWETTHLPGMLNGLRRGYIYTRMVIPVGADRTRLFYFHSTKPSSRLGRLYEKLMFYGYRNWIHNYNFSDQDGKANTYLYYDRPEYLSATDSTTPIAWRRLVLRARGVEPDNAASETINEPASLEMRV